MVSPVTLTSGQTVKTKVNNETFGNLAATFNKYLGECGGAYDIMSTAKKIAQLADHPAVPQLTTYVAGTAVPRLYGAANGFYKDIQKARTEPMSTHLASRLVFDVTEVSAMTSFTIGFFTKNFRPFVDTGIMLKAGSDAAETVAFAAEAIEANRILREETHLSPEVRSGVQAKANYSLIKLAKVVSGAISGFFSSWTIMKGSFLIASKFNTTISLASSLLNIVAYQYKNYGSKYFAEIENPKKVIQLA